MNPKLIENWPCGAKIKSLRSRKDFSILNFHCQADALTPQIHIQYLDQYLLLERYHLSGVLDELAGSQLRYVDKALYMYAYVHECAKVGDVVHYSGQYHAGLYILNGMDLI